MNLIKNLIILLLLISCSTTKEKRNKDIFDKLLHVQKSHQVETLDSVFGKPTKITINRNKEKVYEYRKNNENVRFDVFVTNDEKKVEAIMLYFWKKEFDNYTFLKDRFKDYKWVEVELPFVKTDVENEPRKVTIPDLGITFEYDNQDPLRRPLHIFFE